MTVEREKNISLKIQSPRQFRPSPKYPVLQEQLYDPLVLLQPASALQWWVDSAHSSISNKNKDRTLNENTETTSKMPKKGIQKLTFENC